MARTAGAAAVVGYIFGYVENSLWGGFYMWLVVYAVGFAIGKAIHKVAAHKLGKKVVATILGGLLIGALLSPASDALLGRNSGMTAAIEAAQGMSEASNPELIANAAIKARKHFPEFEKAFKAQTTDQYFLVKAPFEEGEEIEHLWLHVDGIDGEKISGRVASQPLTLENVKANDKKQISIKDIDDFRYNDEEGEEHGNFSINRAAQQQLTSALEKYNNPFQTSSCWMHLLILAFGMISPVIAVKVRN